MVLGAPLFVFLSPPGPVGREIRRAVFFHTPAWEGLLVVGGRQVPDGLPPRLDPAAGEGASL